MATADQTLTRCHVVIGVDTEHAGKAAALLQALQIPLSDVLLVNVVESALPDGGYPTLASDHPISVLLRNREAEGQLGMDQIASQLTAERVAKLQLHGSPAEILIAEADRIGAELIAVGSSQRGKWGSLFFGSVTKALSAEAKQSILIAKNEIPRGKPIRAVIATDHSSYSHRCIKKLLSLRPKGLTHAVLVTATADPSMPSEVRDRAFELSAELSRDFESVGIKTEILVQHDDAQELIAKAMREFDANLLALGARGHGFWERLWLGSVAHYHVVATPHNVLVIRG